MDTNIIDIEVSDTAIVKLILEYLEDRQLCGSQLSLERETGLINGGEDWSEEIHVTRQFILDGRWSDVVTFLETVKEHIDFLQLQRILAKYEYLEMLYNSNATSSQISAFIQDKMIGLFKAIEVPHLNEELPPKSKEAARLKCFLEVLPLLKPRLGLPESNGSRGIPDSSQNGRLLQLLVKGLLYEACVDYCQCTATEFVRGDKASAPAKMGLNMLARSNLVDSDASLLSWLYVLPADTFSLSFVQPTLQVHVEKLSASFVSCSDDDEIEDQMMQMMQEKKPQTNPPIRCTSSSTTKSSASVDAAKTSSSHVSYDKVAALEDVQAIRCASLRPSGDVIAIGSNSKALRVCAWPDDGAKPEPDVKKEAPLTVIDKVMRMHVGSIYCVCWHPGGRVIASGSNDKMVKLVTYVEFDGASTRLDKVTDVCCHTGTVRDICFLCAENASEAPALLSAGAGDCSIRVSDVSTQQTLNSLQQHEDTVYTLSAVSASEFISGSQDGTWRFWDLRSRSHLVHTEYLGVPYGSHSVSSVHANTSFYKYNLIATGHENGIVRLWDTRKLSTGVGKPHCSLGALAFVHKDEVRSVRFSSLDPMMLLSASYDSTVSLNQITTTTTMMNGNNQPPQQPASSSSTTTTDVSNNGVHVWTGMHKDRVVSVRWHPSEDAFVSCSADRSCCVWKARPSPVPGQHKH